MSRTAVALRVDVDTRRGLESGVPRLLELFRATGVRATFFVTMGPDRSGTAIRRAWRPAFLAKMVRTNPLALYGVRTLLSGTLLRATLVGAGAPSVLGQIAADGHELAPHGFDHVGWQDRVHRFGEARIRADLCSAARAFEAAVGRTPGASAAPGWRTTPEALVIQEEMGYRYASDVRGRDVFHPWVRGDTLKTVQVPTTMPTMDELLGRVRDIADELRRSIRPGLNVFTVHAEVEGGRCFERFRTFLGALRRQAVEVVRVIDVVEEATAARALPAATVVRGRVGGRSGWVAVQGPTAGTA